MKSYLYICFISQCPNRPVWSFPHRLQQHQVKTTERPDISSAAQALTATYKQKLDVGKSNREKAEYTWHHIVLFLINVWLWLVAFPPSNLSINLQPPIMSSKSTKGCPPRDSLYPWFMHDSYKSTVFLDAEFKKSLDFERDSRDVFRRNCKQHL